MNISYKVLKILLHLLPPRYLAQYLAQSSSEFKKFKWRRHGIPVLYLLVLQL